MATILVADDDARIRHLVRLTLLGDGHDVLVAADGDAALAALRAHRPAVAILDVQMPGRSGLDVCRALRLDPDLAGIGVVIVSANTTAGQVRAAGADAYLLKPFSPRGLLAEIQRLVAAPARIPPRSVEAGTV